MLFSPTSLVTKASPSPSAEFGYTRLKNSTSHVHNLRSFGNRAKERTLSNSEEHPVKDTPCSITLTPHVCLLTFALSHAACRQRAAPPQQQGS